MKTLISVLVCLAIVVIAPITGCASDPLPVGESTNVDLSDPDDVITNAMATMFTWNPTREESPDSAYRQAAIYLSGDLVGQSDQSTDPGPGSQWQQWRADGAAITAKVYLLADETPPNTDDVMHRVVAIVQTAATEDNRLIDEIRHTAWVVANKSNNGWRITSIQF